MREFVSSSGKDAFVIICLSLEWGTHLPTCGDKLRHAQWGAKEREREREKLFQLFLKNCETVNAREVGIKVQDSLETENGQVNKWLEYNRFTLTWSTAFLIILPTSCLHSGMSGLASSRFGEKDKSRDLKNSVTERKHEREKRLTLHSHILCHFLELSCSA